MLNMKDENKIYATLQILAPLRRFWLISLYAITVLLKCFLITKK